MFDRNLFTYDEENHLGYYNGKLVPSATQLVDLLYPMNENIPMDRLQKAADRGTQLHEGLLSLNQMFDVPYAFERTIKESLNMVKEVTKFKKELLDYVALLNTYGLRPFDYEELVFLLDENDDLICYGHYDSTMEATRDIDLGDTHLFTQGLLYMVDYKATSLFNRPKVAFQTSIYATAYEQMSKNYITNCYGMWFNEGIKLIPLNRQDSAFTIKLCKQLKQVWEKNNEIH